MLTATGEYALRAMVYLARNAGDRPIPGPRIAQAAGVPPKYLSAILADLVRAGLLEATRGKSGGFQMTRSPRHITLAQVLTPFEPVQSSRKLCPFGNQICSDKDPCGAHAQWKEVTAAYSRFLERTTLEDVATKATNGSRVRVKR